ncbi:hypothetical protein U3516DRAFT_740423 [Neocallimastix sp. 'constans']
MDDQLEISETNKEKNQIILKKCKSYIILNDNNKVIKYENKHTHPGKEYDASVSIIKHKMKNEIRKTSIQFDINPKHI